MRWGWGCYAGLCAVRVVCALAGWGFVHPDEWLQSAEVSARDLFGRPAQVPWEYQPPPARSALNLLCTTSIPFWLLSSSGTSPTPWALMVAARLFGLAKSFVLDLLVHRLARSTGQSPLPALLLLGCSWPMLVLMVRPLSNANEAVLLAAGLLVALSGGWSLAARRSWCGAIMAAGFWTRISFPGFFGPVCLWLGLQGSGWWPARLCSAGVHTVLTGFLPVAGLLCLWDSIYFGNLQLELDGRPLDSPLELFLAPWAALVSYRCAGSCFVLTPVNNLVYNLDSAALSTHGLHPRCTHALVNLWLLYGWLPLSAALAARRSQAGLVLAGSMIGGLGFLSTAPHQEPRFLLPMLAPMVVLAGSALPRGRGALWLLGLLNCICTVLFGFMHQAGVLPGLAHLSAQSADGVFYKTYVVPQGLMQAGSVRALGSDLAGTMSAIRNSTMLGTPGSVPLARMGIKPGEWTEEWRWWPHLSMESPPNLQNGLAEEFSFVLYRKLACAAESPEQASRLESNELEYKTTVRRLESQERARQLDRAVSDLRA